MEQLNKNSKHLKEGIITAIPIVIGYIPASMGFGLIAKTMDISFINSLMFSVFVYAGASQFMALDLLKAGVATGEIILATFLLNLRHLMMSASIATRLKINNKKWLPLIGFGVSDESFSISALREGNIRVPFILALQIIPYIAWFFGTTLGYLVGTILPSSVQNSMGICLYAMFVAILIPEIKKSLNVLFLSFLSATIYLLMDYFKLLPTGWNVIIAIILTSSLGVIFLKDETKEIQS